METHGHIEGGRDGNHIIGMGGAPTVVLGPGAGAGSFIITGFDNGFTLQVTAGAGSSNNAIVATVTFNTPFLVIPHVVFAAGNSSTAAANNRMFIGSVTLNSLTFNITNPSLHNGTVYLWRFIVIG